MELRHLRYFVAVAEDLNFTKAAAKLHLAQPSLTRQIHNLEEELGVRLLNRTKSHVALTEEGRSFLGTRAASWRWRMKASLLCSASAGEKPASLTSVTSPLSTSIYFPEVS